MATLPELTSPHANGETQAHSAPVGLKVIIAGGGIGGFTAAIALRQQGHDVELYEQSKFANEVGAAIHVAPNATGLLRRLGVRVEDRGAVLLEQIRLISQSGELLATTESTKSKVRWQNKWYFAHRAHLHTHLKEVATSADGRGRPVQVHTSSKVAKVDAHTGTLILQDGTEVHGDLIVGADGVHSVIRAAVAEKEFLPHKSENSAMRFLISKESALADPVTRGWVAPTGSMDMWYGPDLKVVLYPCVDNTLFNFVCLHPAALSDTSNDYNKSASKAKLLKIYRDFEPKLIHMLKLADADTLKVYPLFDLKTLPTFVNGRLALIGDAAHPFTPHLAQGGAQAIEDAVSLGVMLPLGTTPEEIPERLKLYNQARYERSTTIQNNSRTLGNGSENMSEYMDSALSHDEFHASTQILREHQWQQKRDLYWRQPIVFGPMPGPRQTFEGTSHQGSSSSSSTITASITFKTSATLLRNLFPNPSYRFSKPDTVATASFSVETLQNLAWLGGGSYDLLGFYIHEVEYTTRSGGNIRGSYCPIMFENLADPISSGREELGYPKVYSDINISGRESDSSDVVVRLAWRGVEWATFHWKDLRAQTSQQAKASEAIENGSHEDEEGKTLDNSPKGMLVHKCIPNSDFEERGKRRADAEYDVFVPSSQGSKTKSTRRAEHAEITIEDLGSKKLPTLHHIVSRLAEIPVFEVVDASVVEADGVRDLSGARRLQGWE